MTCPICSEPNGPSLASHEGPESVLTPSLRGASARLFVRRALPYSGDPAAASAAHRATCRAASSMLHARACATAARSRTPHVCRAPVRASAAVAAEGYILPTRLAYAASTYLCRFHHLCRW